MLETLRATPGGRTIDITFRCKVRYVDHRANAEQLLQIDVLPGDDCEPWLQAGKLSAEALKAFPGIRDKLANVDVAPERDRVTLKLQFHHASRFWVTQGSDSRSLIVLARASSGAETPARASAAVDPSPAQATPGTSQTAQTPVTRPAPGLGTAIAAATPSATSPVPEPGAPRETVTALKPDEAMVTGKSTMPAPPAQQTERPAADAKAPASLPDGGGQAALAEARNALLDGQPDVAIAAFSTLLTHPDTTTQREALEYLGVAYERAGRTTDAMTSYERYLATYGDGPAASRVTQRLEAIRSAGMSLRLRQSPEPQRRWLVAGEVSQDFWQLERETETEALGTDAQRFASALTLAQLRARRSGERWQLEARVNGGLQHVMEAAGNEAEDQVLVSESYVEASTVQGRWLARVGRQTLFGDGVLGRFDGVRAEYQWKPGIRLNVTAGLPVDSPRFAADTDRQFAGASVAFEELTAGLSVSLFAHGQLDSGNSARQAVGGELDWHLGPLLLRGLLDYDASFNVLNNALLDGRMQLGDHWQAFARGQLFAMPYLTTRNALIGQPVATMDELLERFTEGQVRTLARHRSSDAWTVAAGVSGRLSPRWRLSAHTDFLSVNGSVASAEVAARPATQRFFSTVDLIGASVLRDGDSFRLGLQVDSSSTADRAAVRLESRLPFGRALRIGPALTVAARDAANGELLVQLQPTLSLLYLWRDRAQFELEGGWRWEQREPEPLTLQDPRFPETEERYLETFVSASLRVFL